MLQAIKRRRVVQPPEFRINATPHFIQRLSERGFDLATLIPFYDELQKAPVGIELEVTIGHATIVGEKTHINRAVLRSGWRGERKK